jgi:predicted nucleic acid-binding protein
MFLDANVVLYAAGAPHPHRDSSAGLILRAGRGEVRLAANAEMLQEVLHVWSRRGLRREGAALVRRTMGLCVATYPVTGGDVDEACSLVESIRGLSVRDAIHAAVMTRHGLREIVSFDADFDLVPGLRRVTPAEAARR